MSKFYIRTENETSIIFGQKMFIDGDYLYVYDGEDLRGMYKTDCIIVAYRTEGAR